MDFGRLETGKGVFNLHRQGSRWIAESAELFTFGENLTSREDVDTERDQDTAPGNPLVRGYLQNGEDCLPCWAITDSNPETDPFDVDRTPKHG